MSNEYSVSDVRISLVEAEQYGIWENSLAYGTLCGLEVVRYLAGESSPATSRQISAATGISRATIYRTLKELVDAGWLVAEGSPRRFVASWRVAGLGLGMLMHNHVREVALRSLLDLAAETNKLVFLSFLDGAETVSTDSVQVVGGRTMPSTAYTRMSALIASAGRAILSQLPEVETERLIAKGVPQIVEAAPGGADHVRLEIRRAREMGFGVCDGEAVPAQVQISAAVLDSSGHPVAAIGVTDARGRAQMEAEYGNVVIQWARRASIELGYRAMPTIA